MTSRAAPTSGRSCLAGSGSSTWDSTSDPGAVQGRAIPIFRLVASSLISLGVLAAAFAASTARAGSSYSPDGAPPDSAVATLRVETLPTGLTVLVDGVSVGRSPVGPLWVQAKPIRVQAISNDPRRFEAARDTLLLYPRPGQTLQAMIDLRPSVLIRTTPEPANIFIAVAGASATASAGSLDTLIGQTPFRLPPKRLERRTFVFEAAEHADSVISGESILELAAAGGPVAITLRRVAPQPTPHEGRRSIFRRKWFQFAMMGVGAALTATSARFRHEGDVWYERYLQASDPAVIPRLYDQTVYYDRLAGESLVSGQVLLTAGIFLLVTTDSR